MIRWGDWWEIFVGDRSTCCIFQQWVLSNISTCLKFIQHLLVDFVDIKDFIGGTMPKRPSSKTQYICPTYVKNIDITRYSSIKMVGFNFYNSFGPNTNDVQVSLLLICHKRKCPHSHYTCWWTSCWFSPIVKINFQFVWKGI